MTLKYIWRWFQPRLSFARPFQLSLACFRIARSPSNSWASCYINVLMPWHRPTTSQTGSVADARCHGTTAAPQYHFLRYQYRRLYGTFYYRNTTSTAVFWHGTCRLMTCSNEDCIIFRLKLQHSACLLTFTSKLHSAHALLMYFMLCCSVVYTKSEMTPLRQWLEWINYNHGTTEYRGIFPRYLPWRKISGTA